MHINFSIKSKFCLLAAAAVAFLFTLDASADAPDPMSQSTWTAGNSSGLGNFQSYCASCHGPEGKGDGMLADILDVKPRNLSDAAIMAAKSDAHLFKVIKDGGASVGLSENMTPFNEQMSDEEIKNVIKYIRSDLCKCTYKAP